MRKNKKVEKLKSLLNDYHIYCAVRTLRGPDSENEALKRIFSARLRSLLGIKPHKAGPLLRNNPKVPYSDIEKALNNIKEADIHYLAHVYYGLLSMKELGIIDEKEGDFLSDLAFILWSWATGGIDDERIKDSICDLVSEYKDFIEDGSSESRN